MTDENVFRGIVQKGPVVTYGIDVEDDKLPILKHRLTVADYHKMGEAGIFKQDARVELIEGELFDMPPLGSGHSGVVRILIHILSRAVGVLALVDVQNPVVLGMVGHLAVSGAALR